MARKSRKNQNTLPPVPESCQIKTWKAALYIRLSVEFNSRRGDSLETQKQIMEAYLALHPEIEMMKTYTDNGVTGRIFARPGFEQMLADAEAGEIDCIVVKDLSRLGRNAIDTGYYIEKYFPLHHIRFIAVNDQYDSETPNNSPSHIIVPLKNMINEAYAADISKKVRSQAHQSMKNGDFIGARPPFGYKKDPDNCHKLLVNEDTAPIIRQIYTWAADGVSLNIIVKRLNEAGIITPGRYLEEQRMLKPCRLTGSGKWHTWTVIKILSSEVYVGDMVQGKTTAIGHKQYTTPPEEWIIVRNTHEPLISREQFAQVQAIRKLAAEKAAQRVSVPYSENILRGRIFCGHCGKNLHRQRHHNSSKYFFHCISNERIGKGSCAAGRLCLNETKLFQTILTIIRQEADTIIGKNLLLKQKDEFLDKQKQAIHKKITKHRQENANSQKFLSSLYESHVTGILTREEYLQMKTGYEETITARIQQIQHLEKQQDELEKQVSHYSCLAEKLAKLDEDTALSARLVDQLIERITVNGPEDIEIQFRFTNEFPRVDEVLNGGCSYE